LTSVTFAQGSKLNSISQSAFKSPKLTSIIIPAGVTSIAYQTFQNATALTSVTFEAGSQLTSIDQDAFDGASSLTSITIPALVSKISSYAFKNSGLTTVIFESPTNLETLKVSIGSNPTFFGSGPVTISAEYPTGPTGPTITILYPPSGIYPVNL
jgi:hypothetical protein